MKQFKPALICVAVLLVISIATFAVIKLIPDEKPSQGENPVENIGISDSIEIISYETDEISSIEISSQNGDFFAIDYSGEGVMREAKMRNADDRLAYSSEQMIILCQYFTPLVAFEEIGKADDADFGFDTPQRTIKVASHTGEVATLLVGDDLPVGDGAYVRLADGEDVYSVGKTVRGILLKTMSDYRDINLFPEISDSAVITMAEYTPAGKKPIKVVLKSEEEIKKDEGKTSLVIPYKLTSPVSANTDPDAARANFLEKIIKIRASRVVEDNPRDLAKYGLATPNRLRFETAEGLKVSLLIGSDAENGGTYVMPEGIPTVIETEEKITLSSLSHADVIQKLLWFFRSSELSGFDYKLSDGREFAFKFSATETETKGSLNGKELTGRNPQNLYMKTVRFTLAGERDAAENFTSPEITVTAHIKGGKTSTLALCRMNERRYAVLIDGKDTGFYVAAAEVSELLEALSLAERGEDIPNMF